MDAPLQLPLHPLLLLPREKERPRFTVRIRWIPSVVCMPRNWPRWKPNENVNWKNNVLDVVDLWRPMAEGQEMCLLPLQEPLLRHEPRGLPRARIRPNLPMDTICDESLVEPAMYRPENPLLDIPAAAVTFNLRNVTLAPPPVTKSATFVKKAKITLSKKTDVNILDTASTLMTEA